MEQPTPWPRPWPGFASPLHRKGRCEPVCCWWVFELQISQAHKYSKARAYSIPSRFCSVQMFSCVHLPSRCFGLKFHIFSTCLGWSASSGILSWQGRHRQIAESLVYQAAGPSKDGWVWLSDGFANEAEHFLEERGPHLSMYSRPNPSGWLSASGRFRGLDSSDQKAREAAASHASQSHFVWFSQRMEVNLTLVAENDSIEVHHGAFRWVELIFWKGQPIKATSGQFWRHSGRNAARCQPISYFFQIIIGHISASTAMAQ